MKPQQKVNTVMTRKVNLNVNMFRNILVSMMQSASCLFFRFPVHRSKVLAGLVPDEKRLEPFPRFP